MGKKPHKPDIDRETQTKRLVSEFDRLLTRAASANQLFYALNLFNGWKIHGPSSSFFTEQIDRLVEDLVVSRIAKQEPVSAFNVLLAIQLLTEAKGFYARLRNFALIVQHRFVDQEPWYSDELDGSHLSTGRVVRNIVDDLRKANCKFLSKAFASTHRDFALKIRNAVAHGSFVPVSGDSNSEWTFADYQHSDRDEISMKPWSLSNTDFLHQCDALFAFHFSFREAMQSHSVKLSSQSFSFTARNQCKADEVLDCEFRCGDVSFTYKGTPLFGIVARAVFFLSRAGYAVEVGENFMAAKCVTTGITYRVDGTPPVSTSDLASELSKKLGVSLRERGNS